MTSQNERTGRGACEELSGAPRMPVTEQTSKRPTERPRESPGGEEPPSSENEASGDHPDRNATRLEDANPDEFE
ncbi:hypothetical protein ACFQ07_02900 [Actinomadura adrarensis]|uniref:Uncharacterized protein n=1 Tax=Actinomadura adrarensis TaxID=1819600 RepID=A0ABW3CBH2_9ACTN